MIRLARVPVQLTPRQTVLVVGVVALVIAAILAAVLFEAAAGGLAGLLLRLTGHRPPRKSSFSTVLDEFEKRLREK